MRVLLFCIFILSVQLLKSQNLVPNGSFETYTLCPNASSEIQSAVPWQTASAVSSTDYFNACSSLLNVPNIPGGYQQAHSGNAFAGLWFLQTPNYREYLQVQFTSSLVAGKTYYVEFFVNLQDQMQNAVNNIAANISVTPPNAPVGLIQSLTPHIINVGNPIINDSINWTKVSGCYLAQGGENYITIGNFFSDAATTIYPINAPPAAAYYFVDDVSVSEIKGQNWQYKDTTICAGSSVQLFPGISDTLSYNLTWNPSTGLNCTNCKNPIANPQTTTTYVLTKQFCNVSFYDTVTVFVKDCSLSTLPNVFTPNEDGTNDSFRIDLPKGFESKDFCIYNRWGNVIYQPEISDKNVLFWDGRTSSGEKVTDGTYFYILKYIDANGAEQERKGTVGLFR
ncbi:MAG: gliding motility-associated C-terminal domain-containing protein [Bacteroidetes bacterium]|nr:gliding motility-associated C-terminal domain-containing protein [Bacteroidota bacterium]